MSFIFISYSRQDQAYVGKLTQALQEHGLPVWLDDRIDYGDTWPRVIQDHLEKCQVFLLVMSSRSEDSHWVQCELSLALELRKPIFPLLFDGRRWLSVAAIQTVDVTGGKLPPDRFFKTVSTHFPDTGATTAKSISIQDVADAPAITVPTEEDNLASEKSIDYTRLRDLLNAQNLKDADYETYLRMLEAVGRKKGDYFRKGELLNFPCADLKTIDRLWVKYSNGKFGFSVQKEIYVQCGAKLDGKYPGDKIWREFGDRVGWRVNNSWIDYNNVTFSPSAPVGPLPGGCGGGEGCV
ncbi:MAG TPA: GUN4 domain-containing protein, partial [Elainellaceae cyanobacterium]